MIDNDKDFLKELRVLLEKYNASIDFDVDDSSDTYGLYGACMAINIKHKDRYEYREILNVNGWSIDSSDL